MTFDPNSPKPPPSSPSGVPPAPVPPPPPPGDAQATPAAAAAPGLDEHGKVKRGRVSAIWIGLIVAALLLLALLIFIAQNSKTVAIHFLGFAGHLSLAVAILAAAVIGVLVVAIPGTARIVQLRRALKKNASSAQQPGPTPG
jgi:uncharacterized integral membrane protein